MAADFGISEVYVDVVHFRPYTFTSSLIKHL